MYKIFKLLIFMMTLSLLFGCDNKLNPSSNLKGVDNNIESKSTFEQDGWMFFSNKSDGNKIYKIKRDEKKLFKINDDNSIILKIEDNLIIYINKSDNLNVYKITTEGLNKSKINDVFKDNNWIYFSTFTQIFKVKNDGTEFTAIFTRSSSGSEMKINEVKDGWIYFEITSEDGTSIERIKDDGTSHEHLRQTSINN